MNFDMVPTSRPNFSRRMLPASVWGIAALIMLVGCVAIISYLLDCLYAERKDRSILFWKSLPVSDSSTVLAKFALAIVIAPLGIYVLAFVTHLVCSGMLLLRQGGYEFLARSWGGGSWFGVQGELVGRLLLSLIWYAPLVGYLMLASVLSRRAPMLTAILPPLVLALTEKLVVDTSYIGMFLMHRLSPIGMLSAVADPQLWLSLPIAAALLYLVVRLRRYRDDT
jgi:ABC-2 type transport system permease protein